MRGWTTAVQELQRQPWVVLSWGVVLEGKEGLNGECAEEARPEWAHVCLTFLAQGPSINGCKASSLSPQILSRQTPTWHPAHCCAPCTQSGQAGVGYTDSLTRGPVLLPTSCVIWGKWWASLCFSCSICLVRSKPVGLYKEIRSNRLPSLNLMQLSLLSGVYPPSFPLPSASVFLYLAKPGFFHYNEVVFKALRGRLNS